MNVVGEPIVHRDSYVRLVEDEINAYFAEVIFGPLFAILADHDVPVDPRWQAIKHDETGRENAGKKWGARRRVEREQAVTSALRDALMSGRVQYSAGVFAGKFSSKISLELRGLGATFDKSSKTFRLAESKIPIDLRGALADAALKTREISEEIIRTLGAIGAAALGLSFGKSVDLIVGDLQKQLVRTVSGLEGISVAPDITPEIRKALDEKLTYNLDLAIKDFTRDEIPELRRLVEENVFAGGRSDRLADIIEARFGVSKRKANFLADQETGLLTAKFREERYAEIGVREYVWSTSHDARVRPDHAILDGRRFSFSSPPVCDRATGRRCNPGEDFRCRCVARPVFSVRAAA